MATSAKRVASKRKAAATGTEAPRKAVERLPVYTPAERDAIHERVCAAIETGVSSRVACEAAGVKRNTWVAWLSSELVDMARYHRAREACADVHAEEIIDVAKEYAAKGDPQGGRLVVDAKKWVAARLFPKRWGDRVDVTSGDAPLAPPGVVVLPVVMVPQPAAYQPPVAEVVMQPAPSALAQLKHDVRGRR